MRTLLALIVALVMVGCGQQAMPELPEGVVCDEAGREVILRDGLPPRADVNSEEYEVSYALGYFNTIAEVNIRGHVLITDDVGCRAAEAPRGPTPSVGFRWLAARRSAVVRRWPSASARAFGRLGFPHPPPQARRCRSP